MARGGVLTMVFYLSRQSLLYLQTLMPALSSLLLMELVS